MEVELEISTTIVTLEIPAVFSQGNEGRLVSEGKYLVFVISVNNFPSERSRGENHSGETHPEQLSLGVEKIKPVNVTLGANTRQLEAGSHRDPTHGTGGRGAGHVSHLALTVDVKTLLAVPSVRLVW